MLHLTVFLALCATVITGASAQVESCSTDDTCFGQGPNNVDLFQGTSVINIICNVLQGSYVSDEQRSFCSYGTPTSKFDFTVRRTGSGTGSLDVRVCADTMNSLLGSGCSGRLGGRTTVGDFQLTRAILSYYFTLRGANMRLGRIPTTECA